MQGLFPHFLNGEYLHIVRYVLKSFRKLLIFFYFALFHSNKLLGNRAIISNPSLSNTEPDILLATLDTADQYTSETLGNQDVYSEENLFRTMKFLSMEAT